MNHLMYKIINNTRVIDEIENFIDWYLHSFLDLLADSWIEDLDIIEWNYLNVANNFKEEILLSIRENLKYQTVLWYKELKNDKFQYITVVWNYRLFVIYTEDVDSKIRIIQDIEFHKK